MTDTPTTLEISRQLTSLMNSLRRIEAMLPGGRAMFQSPEQFAAAANGGTAEYVASNVITGGFQDEVNGFRYRVNTDDTVSSLTSSGERVNYRNWKAFWAAAHAGERQ